MKMDVMDLLHSQQDTVLNALRSVATILIVLLIMIIFLRVINRLMERLSINNRVSKPLVYFLRTVLRWIVFVAFVLLVLQQVGIEINSIWTLLTATAAMVAIGFVAVWSILSNLLCTLLLIIFKPFQIGDTIELIDPGMTAGIKGKVKNINLIYTTLVETSIENSDGWRTQIPNNLFFQRVLRCQPGKQTISLDKQVFETESLIDKKIETPPEKKS